MLTANAWLTIRRVPIVHHLRSLTGWTVKRLYDQHRRSCPGLDVHDPASPLVCIDQGGLRKSTNLGHYPVSSVSQASRCSRGALGSKRAKVSRITIASIGEKPPFFNQYTPGMARAKFVTKSGQEPNCGLILNYCRFELYYILVECGILRTFGDVSSA
jgi:hypothetical protein